jgi:hypothetical protein
MKVTLHLVALSDYEPMDDYGDPNDQHFYFDLDLDFSDPLLAGLTLVKEGEEGKVILDGQQVASVDLPYQHRTMRYTFMVRGATRKL